MLCPIYGDRPGNGVILGIGDALPYRIKAIGGNLGHQHPLAGGGEALGDGGQLLWGFPLPIDNLGEATAQGAMMIDLGKAQLLIGEVF